MKNNNSFSFVDLFSGAGGLSLGFAEEGFECLQAIDNDKHSVDTYNFNFKDHVECKDVNLSNDFPQADVYIGGPPCQGFSSAGVRAQDDHRNTLVGLYAKLISRIRPKAFVFENVEGFLTYDKGSRVFDLLDPLIHSGYRIHLHKINAANYGIPQHRKRVIAIGCLGWDPTFPQPTHRAFGAPGAHQVDGDLVTCQTIKDALRDLPEASSEPPGRPQGHFVKSISYDYIERIKHLDQGQTMRDLPKEFWHQSYKKRANRRVKDGMPTEKRGGAPSGIKRLIYDQPSKAITGGTISEFVHPIKNRPLTIRECARIQTFPDYFEFKGPITKQIQQIGNAVPPRLGKVIARSIHNDLSKDEIGDKPGALISFIPTVSNGVSPVLKAVIEEIEDRYITKKKKKKEQLPLPCL